ncbi:MAG: hypothetical protein AAF431_16920 [Pseudomonadota bacterium]
MALLESALAFAVAMMIFSTIVTGIVEAILRTLGTREKNLRKTIEALFDKVVMPRLGEGLKKLNTPVVEDKQRLVEVLGLNKLGITTPQSDPHKENFVAALTENPVFEPSKNPLSGERKSKIDSLSLLAFAERLGKTDTGRAIVAEGEAQTKLLVEDLVRSFDRYGRAAAEVFRKKTQLTAIFVAIPFAWVANIDASRLLMQLIENPSLRTSLIEQAEQANQENQAAIERLNNLKQELSLIRTTNDSEIAQQAVGEPVTEEQARQGEAEEAIEAEATEEEGSGESELAALEKKLNKVADDVVVSVKKLEAEGLAIGWEYYPFCGKSKVDDDCDGRVGWKKIGGGKATFEEIFWDDNFIIWLFMSTLAGILIGLGGPFWFKVFTKLSSVLQIARALTFAGRNPAHEDLTPKEQSAEESAKPKDILDAFNVAAAVNVKSAPIKQGRTLLGPNGLPL